VNWARVVNPFNAELNPICHLLALLGAHHILHVSRIRVKYKIQIKLFERTNNFICILHVYVYALLGAHHILHVRGVRINDAVQGHRLVNKVRTEKSGSIVDWKFITS
jgi:hypothetical protein